MHKESTKGQGWFAQITAKMTSLIRPDDASLPVVAPSPKSVDNGPRNRVQNIYPPEDQGLPLQDTMHLIEGNESLISRVRLHAATDRDKFELRFLSPIRNLAELINTLPGTSSSLFAGPGGLLRASLEMGFLCFQASDGRIFTGAETVEVRHKLEPRWRYICFLAGLLHPVGVPLVRMVVSSKSGENWPKHQYDITAWAKAKKLDRVYVNWSDETKGDVKKLLGPSPYTASILHKIVGPENLSWLEEGSPDLTRTLFELVGGTETNSLIAKDVIATMWKKVLEREESRRPQNYGRMTVGTHLTPYLVGAMRTLLAEGKWKPNEEPVFVDQTGVYLKWPQAGNAVIKQGENEGRDGWPSSTAVLAEILKQDGVFDTSSGNDMGMTQVVDKDGELHQAFKLKKPTSILENYEPSDYVKASPKTLTGVLLRDPLAAMEAKAAQVKEVPIEPAPVAVVATKPAPSVEPAPEPAPVEVPPAVVAAPEVPVTIKADLFTDPLPKPTKPLDTAQKPVTPAAVATEKTQEAGRITEVDEVKFSDLVPPGLRKELRSTLTTELLGKVIKAWRERGENSQSMRMTDNGAAFTMEFLGTLIRSIPDWVNDMANAGLVYSPKGLPGVKVHKVAVPEGAKAKECVILNDLACRKLGL
jgi:hypothetical protein